VNGLNRIYVHLVQAVGITLGLFDAAFGTHLSERVVDRLTHRWQQRLDTLNAELAALETERRGLEAQASALALQAAVYYLGARVLSRDELCFDPSDPEDERMLDATIDLLVKSRLASVELHEPSPGRTLYRVDPHWDAIRETLEGLRADFESPTDAWLDECLLLIDEIAETRKNEGEHHGTTPD
jgi:hypothetical protein